MTILLVLFTCLFFYSDAVIPGKPTKFWKSKNYFCHTKFQKYCSELSSENMNAPPFIHRPDL